MHAAKIVRTALAAVALVGGAGMAADQTILGNKFLIKDPGLATKRRVIGSAREKLSPNTVTGDPVANGGALEVFVDGGTPGTQVFSLPPSGWAIQNGGFKYKDQHGVNGPVKNVRVKLTNAARFLVRVQVLAKNGPITIVPPNPGTSACFALTLNGGDRYSVDFGPTSVLKNNGTRVFSARKPLAEGVCPGSSPTTSTTTSTSIPTSTTTSSSTSTSTSSTTSTTIGSASPSFVFVDDAGLF